MSKVRVPLHGKAQGYATLDSEATKGATVGVNLFWADGTLVTKADFNPAPAAGGIGGVSQTLWSLVLQIPANVTALEKATGTGLFAVTGAGTGAFRTLADSPRIVWTNGNGVAGNPTPDLAAVADAGGGTLQKTVFDSYGRKTGTSAATTTDLPEGTNLYHTAQRVRDTLLTGLSTATNAVIAATDSVLTALGKLQAQVSGILANYVTTARTIATTAPLTGGGDLSANRTLAISAATTVAAGSMSAADKAKLDGIEAGATATINSIAAGDTTHPPSRNAVFDALALKADDSAVVKLTGNQTIAGVKTLSSNLTVLTETSTPGVDIGNFGATKYRIFHDDLTGTGSTLEVIGAGQFSMRINGAVRWQCNSLELRPAADNALTFGSAAARWVQLYAVNGTINTSDAREKTPVRPLGAAEIAAAKQIAREIGSYQWLASLAAKGEQAREHIGLTVQRCIEVMAEHGLDAFRYGFVCYDQWDETPEVRDPETGGVLLAYRPAGDRYSFRMDQLCLFLAAGFEARLAALEA